MICTGCEFCRFDVKEDIPDDIHEIHVTVKSVGDNSDFIELCETNDIKPIVIVYNNVTGGTNLDPMTSMTFYGSCDDALSKAKEVAVIFSENGLDVLRIKIETSPTNTEALGKPGYFESHLAVLCNTTTEKILRNSVEEFKFIDDVTAHVSANAFKYQNETKTVMVTHRRKNCDFGKFKFELESLKLFLQKRAFTVEKTIIEYCWHDDNISHDNKWMGTVKK